MEQKVHSGGTGAYDFRQYDRVWQRVAPDLEPYPGMGTAAVTQATAPAPARPAERQEQGMAAAGSQLPAPSPAGQPVQDGSAAGLSSGALAGQVLPGAETDPCCMGSGAAEMLEVLAGFIEEELEDRRQILAMIRQAPSWARQGLREMAAEEGDHARRLMAVYYLITGRCYQAALVGGTVNVGRWCPMLRERYHMEACDGLNYARAAEGTTDPCLRKLLNELSEDEYGHAETLMGMLERSIQGRN